MPDTDLSPRQLEILPYLAQGLNYIEIAEEMGISEHTVRGHIHRMLRRLGVVNTTAAVALAIRDGLLIVEQIEFKIRDESREGFRRSEEGKDD